jgi:hypothetical protein
MRNAAALNLAKLNLWDTTPAYTESALFNLRHYDAASNLKVPERRGSSTFLGG